MLFKIVDDWKQMLPPEDEKRLNAILRNTAKHRSAYRTSKDVKSAQLWCALLEMRKENQVLLKKVKRLEYIFEGLAERMRQENLEEKEIIESLEKF